MRNEDQDPSWLPPAMPEPAPEEMWDLCLNCGGHDVSVFHDRAFCEDCGSSGPFMFSAGTRRRRVALA
jgi:hypothetical protein